VNAQKHYFCNHIITVAAKLKLFDFDSVLMNLPLEKKIARGRKKMPHNCLSKPKTKKASENSINIIESVEPIEPVTQASKPSTSKAKPSASVAKSSRKSQAKSKESKAKSPKNSSSKRTPSSPTNMNKIRKSKRVKS
jgi:hypothetical protein